MALRDFAEMMLSNLTIFYSETWNLSVDKLSQGYFQLFNIDKICIKIPGAKLYYLSSC